MCKTGSELRAAWYAVSVQIPARMSESQAMRVIEENRREPRYIESREALINHIKKCSVCRGEMR